NIVLPVLGSRPGSGAGGSMRMIRAGSTSRLFAVLWMSASVPGIALAQTAVTGRVTDPQSKAVTGATVRLALSNRPAAAEAPTDDAGQYGFRNIAAGVYRLTVSAPGFTAISQPVSLAPA